MPFDQLFKELLHTFFREFIELFYPDVAARLDFDRVTFLDKELFTDLHEGSQREPDVIARVYTIEGEPELILMHVEVQANREREFSYRMYEYYIMLWLRYKIPIFPVALYLSPGAGGLTEESYTANLFGRDILTFRYAVVSLPDLSADEYLELDNPLGTGLSAMMQPSQFGKLAQKYRSLMLLSSSSLDPARKSMLAYLVASNLILSVKDEAEFKEMIVKDQNSEANSMLDIDEMFRDLYKGIYEERGLAQGIQQGLIQGERNILLKLIRRKFGALPEDYNHKIETLDTEAELDELSYRILTANSLEQLGL